MITKYNEIINTILYQKHLNKKTNLYYFSQESFTPCTLCVKISKDCINVYGRTKMT